MTEPWICHFDEDTRALLHAVLADAVGTLNKVGPQWTEDWLVAGDVVVPRAARLNGSRRAVRVVQRDTSFSLFVPATSAPRRMQLSVHGALAGNPGGIEGVARTMKLWLDALSVPLDPGCRDASMKFRGDVATLLLGVVERSEVDWNWAEARTSRDGDHVISIQPSGCRRGQMPIEFRVPSVAAGARSISPELALELSRIVGHRTHVAEGHVRRRSDMPSIFVGLPPLVRITRENEPMTLMRAMASVPPGARLIP